MSYGTGNVPVMILFFFYKDVPQYRNDFSFGHTSCRLEADYSLPCTLPFWRRDRRREVH
jgi:hypothetical protein